MTASPAPVILLMGPTASGKTELALALCKQFDAEIISVDSAQVYRGMDIGTAKPDAQTQARWPHHLIDILDPTETYSAARFASDALRLIAEIRARNRVPLLVGGTMLYYRALTQGFNDLPPADPALRLELEQEAAREGWPAMHARLSQLDPESGSRLHPNDQQRIQRALEIIGLTGLTPTQFYARSKSATLEGAIVKIALNPPHRAELHERIARRFHGMMQQGFLQEVSHLHARGDLHLNLPSIRSVGYRQLWQHLDGECSLDEAIERGIAATRQFAKRQLTWLRSEDSLHWFNPAEPGALGKIMNLLQMTGS